MNGPNDFGSRGFRPGRGPGGRRPGPQGPFDLGNIFDEIFEAAENFRHEFRQNFKEADIFNDNTDYYPSYSYPPMNVLITGDRSLIFEFALAGFEEKDISLSFLGDHMIFSAVLPQLNSPPEEGIRYFKRRLKMKDIEKQKYFVPLDKYAQDKVKAVFKNGILKVTIPPKEEPDQNEGIKIEILT
ncbi:MAG: Hsp20/alpha crystallin family protein [Treponema sp.]|nr:Hsp20/alpha crystallin family protein [Treponema sp.]